MVEEPSFVVIMDLPNAQAGHMPRSFYRALKKFRAVKRLKSVYIASNASAMEELVTLARYYGFEAQAFESNIAGSLKAVRTVTRETFYIVDYDLRQGSNRRQFYRSLRRYREKHNLMDGSGWSTQSVVITTDQEFAEFVFELASHVGQAHIYRAKKVR